MKIGIKIIPQAADNLFHSPLLPQPPKYNRKQIKFIKLINEILMITL